MISLFIGQKCCLCGERSKNLDSVCGYGIYGSRRKYYHRACLKDITCDPEHYKHIQVDMAIGILDKLKEEKAKALRRRRQFKKQCEEIQNYCNEEPII